MNVRVAGEDDLDALVALRLAWNEEAQGQAIDDPAFAASFVAWMVAEAPTRTFFLAEVDGEPVGMANVKRYERMPAAGMPSAGWWGYVGNVFVLPVHRDAGIGAALMESLRAWAWDNGYERLRLAPSPKAGRFYERLGYVAGHVVQLAP